MKSKDELNIKFETIKPDKKLIEHMEQVERMERQMLSGLGIPEEFLGTNKGGSYRGGK
jgi:hypothetical protein